MYILTAISAGLFLFLNWAFANNQWSLSGLWDSKAIGESTIFTYLLLALIIVAGVYQAQRLPTQGVATSPKAEVSTPGQTDDPMIWKLLMGNAYWSLIWLPLRFFVGRDWLTAGEHKLRDAGYMDGGASLQKYWQSAVAVPQTGSPKINANFGWFRDFLQYMLDHQWYTWFAKLIAIGEFLVGVGLIVGALVGIAAFFGTLMNFNFMLAGSASTNPVLFGLGVFLVLAWKVAGYWGVDRYLLPSLGAPWKAGTLIKEHKIGHMEPPPVTGKVIA
jgi:thiosulfate dehydrogenase [quinone] large subunit